VTTPTRCTGQPPPAALEVVRLLADAGGEVVGSGDDHELEVIGWATCWEGGDDAHRAVADFLVARGARHHVFSAIALNLADEVRRIVAAEPAALKKPMSRHENRQLPLHFAARKSKPAMVDLLLELGADPAATDGEGVPASVYAAAPEVDPAVIESLSRAAESISSALSPSATRRPRRSFRFGRRHGRRRAAPAREARRRVGGAVAA
jgi:Ankyrin repeat